MDGRRVDDLERLREIHDGDERIEPSAYANLVRRALRLAPEIARELLQHTYKKGLQEAYSSSTPGAVGKVAQMGAEQLNAVGDHAGAIARLDQALQMAGDDPISRTRILAARSMWEVLSEQPSVAKSTLEAAVAGLPDDPDPETAIALETNSAKVSLALLEAGAIEPAIAAIAHARSNEFDWMTSATMVFLIQTLGASADVNQAIAWADALQGYAAAQRHAARELDATVSQLALRARQGLVEPDTDLDEAGRRTLNSFAVWRVLVLRLYVRVMRGDSEGAAAAAAAIEEARGEMNAGYSVCGGGFGALVEAHFGSKPAIEPAPSSAPTVLMLSGALAAAEAVATSGSQSLAADWLRWFETRVPAFVASSLEWPSCRTRVEGLLLLRLGREREAVTRLQDGIRCCEEQQNDVQAAVGRLQLAEALLRGSTASMLPAAHARSLRETGTGQLRELSIDPIPFAYAASRTFLQDEQIPERGGLTPREAQVLGRLARGMTYREIGAELGINSRTVGVHASHCYEKLGVRNRVEAVKLAQELGIV